MDVTQIIADLKKKVYHPVYFLMGEEPYFIDLISDYIEKNILDETEKEFNQTILYGRDINVLSLISHAKRYPMMANHQVIIVREAQNIKDLTGREKQDKNDKSKSPFLEYIENPQKSTILVICYKYKTLDKRTSKAKTIEKRAVLFESKKLYENQIPNWINNYLRDKDYIIGPKASLLLSEYLGADLSKIANELDKLMLNIPAKSEITAEQIQNNIGISKDYNTFELQKALGTKDILKANRIVNYFAANPGEHPLVMTVGILFSYFSKIIIYHYLSDKSKNNAASALGVNPFFISDYEKAARNYGIGKLKTIISDLREYDLKSKGLDNVTTSEGELLKELVFKILH